MPDKPKPGGYNQRRELQKIMDRIVEVEDIFDEIIAPLAAGDKKWTQRQITLFWQAHKILESIGDSAFIAQKITQNFEEEEKKIVQFKRRTGSE